MHLSELFPFLASLGLTPKKSLSQNFLIDSNIVEKIVRTAQITPGETILEIGPGPGALTRALLAAKARVIAVEKDPQFAKALWRLQTSDGRLVVHHADILKFSIPASTRIVANLPYHITTPILEKILLGSFSSCTLMMQKEMADRLLTTAGSKTFGSLSLFVQFYGTIREHFTVPASCFYPRPRVDSALLRIDARMPPLTTPHFFFKIIRGAFQQRRKMMSSSLKIFFPSHTVQNALKAIGLRSDARPEMLGLEEWLRFYHIIFDETHREIFPST